METLKTIGNTLSDYFGGIIAISAFMVFAFMAFMAVACAGYWTVELLLPNTEYKQIWYVIAAFIYGYTALFPFRDKEVK